MEILQFKPILKTTLWGGKRILALKEDTTTNENIGESWEISDFPENETLIENKSYAGQTLHDIITNKKEILLGKHVWDTYGDKFPLLIKIIDANKDLSVQVHPDDYTAKQMGQPRGKTEMWYVIDAAQGTQLVNGLTPGTNARDIPELLRKKLLDTHLHKSNVTPGDCFFIEAGTVHSIGAGCFVAEIQQSSNTTYRLYDFNRPDSNGKLRQLQIPEAIHSIKPLPPKVTNNFSCTPEGISVKMVECPYFTTCIRSLTQPTIVDYKALDSFVIVMATQGNAILKVSSGQQIELRYGHTAFIPACTDGTISIDPTTPTFSMLEIYV